MHEWHGWATLRTTPAPPGDDDLDQDTLSAVKDLLSKSDGTAGETADLRNVNGEWHLWLAGRRDHRNPDIENLYRSVAQLAPGSYGIMYTFDSEGSGGWNRWSMRRGAVRRNRDEDLSPHVGLVEDRPE
jgi:hypothetical protein